MLYHNQGSQSSAVFHKYLKAHPFSERLFFWVSIGPTVHQAYFLFYHDFYLFFFVKKKILQHSEHSSQWNHVVYKWTSSSSSSSSSSCVPQVCGHLPVSSCCPDSPSYTFSMQPPLGIGSAGRPTVGCGYMQALSKMFLPNRWTHINIRNVADFCLKTSKQIILDKLWFGTTTYSVICSFLFFQKSGKKQTFHWFTCIGHELTPILLERAANNNAIYPMTPPPLHSLFLVKRLTWFFSDTKLIYPLAKEKSAVQQMTQRSAGKKKEKNTSPNVSNPVTTKNFFWGVGWGARHAVISLTSYTLP